MYKLIALDMDGTLLNSQKQISPRTKQAIAQARQQGIQVFWLLAALLMACAVNWKSYI